MKFSCEKFLLSYAVAAAAHAAPSKSSIDALTGLKIEAGDDSVCITGYDLKKAIYTPFAANVFRQGTVLLNARLLSDIVRKLPDGIVTFNCNEDNNVNISCGNADYNLAGYSAEEYPELPAVESGHGIVIKQGVLSSMIRETSFAIAKNESRPVYTGALMELENNVMTMVTVDGYRLAVRKEAVETSDSTTERFIVPGNALSDIEKLCQSPDEFATITVSGRHITFYVGDTVLITRRLEGEFLNYKKTIPQNYSVQMTVRRDQMISSVDRVSLIIDDNLKHPIRCIFRSNEMALSTTTPLGHAEDSCEAEGEGKGLEVGFNNIYLMDALKAAPEDKLKINLSGPNSPCIITADDDKESFLYMVLPIRLS